ncbi:hypothetical protein L249_7608 [Ophiocordyceps polyrhachis-furcata BCC 54312]|uniref:Zn(2)-C6 fungal-type domain-containing protein n=1 Tax=Ophiocordyceps polyrhachis-furcata BCC 54312 TaxID=1330021 RepID=A0A367LAA3_9HYPO|nr:hypothetical protein L249_7608 [Ophiocordyceps polyrhachis-furcata BCC 54312]
MQPKLTLSTDRGAHPYFCGGDKEPDYEDWNVMALPSPCPTETTRGGPSVIQPGQLSPVSAGTSLTVESRSSHMEEYYLGAAPVAPKVEADDKEIKLSHVKVAPSTPRSSRQKRPRGRPRKTWLASTTSTSSTSATKTTNGRSKTGCITCRKRKKKCDEAKPRCMNCEKNAVIRGDGGLTAVTQKKKRKDEYKGECLPGIVTMPPLIYGIETSDDRILWRHYVGHLSNVLTVEGEARNAFKDVILQLANQHQGLMHSVLALSSKHLDVGSPYGVRMLQSHPGTSRESLQRRAEFHHAEALKRLYEDLEKSLGRDDPEYQTMLAGRYGQILCLLLETRTDGNPRGEHRLHLQAYQSLIEQSPPGDAAFKTFVTEFFQYHVYADDLFWHPAMTTRRLPTSESWQPPGPMDAPRLLGVADGLFQQLSRITGIRNAIRDKLAAAAAAADPVVDHGILSRAVDVDAAIRDWSPRWPPGDSRNRAAPLFKQVMWVYLFRTIYPPPGSLRPSHGRDSASVDAADQKGAKPSPPSPACSSSSSSTSTSTSSSYSPTRSDERITLAVNSSLSMLESFRPSDPVQTLLLVPCLLIGTACFQTEQRVRVRRAVGLVRGYTGLGSCDRLVQLLEELWCLMDEGEWLAVWDWQGVARRMGLDFLCA